MPVESVDHRSEEVPLSLGGVGVDGVGVGGTLTWRRDIR